MELLNMPQTEPFTINFDSLGYETTYYMINMGSLLIIQAIYLLVTILAYIVRNVTQKVPLIRNGA